MVLNMEIAKERSSKLYYRQKKALADILKLMKTYSVQLSDIALFEASMAYYNNVLKDLDKE